MQDGVMRTRCVGGADSEASRGQRDPVEAVVETVCFEARKSEFVKNKLQSGQKSRATVWMYVCTASRVREKLDWRCLRYPAARERMSNY